MNALVATFLTALISAFFVQRFDRQRVKTSRALWIPMIWLTIACSRPISNWMSFGAPANSGDQYLDGSPIDRNILSLLVVLAFYTLFQRRNQLRTIISLNPALVLFLGYCFLSILWADYPFVAFKRWIRAVADVAMPCIILTERHPDEAMKKVFTGMAALLLPLSIIFTRLFPSLGRAYTYSGVPMWTGVATDKNALGALCMIVGITLLGRGLSIWAAPRRSDAWQRLALIASLFLIAVYLLLMIDSKTALASFTMAAMLVIMRALDFRQPWLFTTTITCMIATCYSVLFLGFGSSAIAEMGRDSSLTGRTQVWETVLPFAVNRWIGAGFENFWIGDRLEAIVRAIGAGINQAHNGYIEIYLNIGWIGLALLGLLVLRGYGNIMADLPYNVERSGLKMAFFFICIVYNFTEAAFKIMAPVWIVFLWATIRVPRTKAVATETVVEPPPISDWHRLNPQRPWPATR
ncbi:MAG TPA: O-antigen ligase family protein [Bryobacteraceae bacterium]|nr:O-antigen ligase family protein [Bryobacteraceae bacterium]